MSGLIEIYGLYEPDSGELRYVGKAKNAAARLKRHILERGLGRPVNRWVKSLVENGRVPFMQVLETVAESEWEAAERRLIAECRKGSRLLNLADGGAMPSQTYEQRKRAAIASNRKQEAKSPAEIKFVKAKQDMGRLYSRFMKDGAKTGSYFHAYVLCFFMRAYYAADPKRHAIWASL